MGKQIIVIPAYNEEATVAQVVRDAIRVADAVVVVDDGSRDRTSALAAEAGAIVVRHAVNRGLGGALGHGHRRRGEAGRRRGGDHGRRRAAPGRGRRPASSAASARATSTS
jgi:cellulose synthase/poly-beta-1,6-N-acetylglucosamine synthase-like glycosyltransferase